MGCYWGSFQSRSDLNAEVDICVVTICGVVAAIRGVELGYGGRVVVGIGRVVVGIGGVVVGIGGVVVDMWWGGCGNFVERRWNTW